MVGFFEWLTELVWRVIELTVLVLGGYIIIHAIYAFFIA